jgi:hypothetical protein
MGTSAKLALILAVATVVQACGGAAEPPPEYPPVETAEPPVEVSVERQPAPEPEPPPPVQVVAGEHAAIEGAAPTLRIQAPRAGHRIRSGT